MTDQTLSELRNTYYRRSYKTIIFLLNIFTLITLILAGGLIYTITHPLTQRYYATSAANPALELTALSEPNLSTMALLRWANTAVIASFTYNWVNYQEALDTASVYYTAEGWTAFMDALDSSNILKTVIAKNLSISAVTTGAPVVLQQGDIQGRYSWRIQMPLLITYESASEFVQQRLVVNLLVARISTLKSPRGIGITQFSTGTGGILG